MNVEPINIRIENEIACLVGEWPQRAAISTSFMARAGDELQIENGQIVLTFANARARYRLADKDAQFSNNCAYSLVFDLIEGTTDKDQIG